MDKYQTVQKGDGPKIKIDGIAEAEPVAGVAGVLNVAANSGLVCVLS